MVEAASKSLLRSVKPSANVTVNAPAVASAVVPGVNVVAAPVVILMVPTIALALGSGRGSVQAANVAATLDCATVAAPLASSKSSRITAWLAARAAETASGVGSHRLSVAALDL